VIKEAGCIIFGIVGRQRMVLFRMGNQTC